MLIQMVIGILMIVYGTFILVKYDKIISKRVRREVGEEKSLSFRNGLAIPLFLLGVLVITMGILEKQNILDKTVYLVLYPCLVIVPFFLLLHNNKKHLGRYRF